MPRTDKSIGILTGMIIAALYVILLVGFTRESYMSRESSMRRDAASRTDGASGIAGDSRMLQNTSLQRRFAAVRGAVCGRERTAELLGLVRRRPSPGRPSL